ncbi:MULTISPECIES: CopG family ribbon-helix-helix protein [Sphingomonas]|jgi:predicted transcriptional regulator|uniref:CopG family ribbon-helix-helix protein n=1 Tax=Sphingomonas TaxID=13687 RepID=UPI001AEDA2BB|nr:MULTISPECIES: CopG family transcriptional regulator [Sphingomonas]
MADALPVTTDVDPETMALVDRVAMRRGISSRDFMAQAIRRAAESDADFDAFIQAGIDSLDRGEGVPHEQVMAELDAMIAKHRARCG